MRHSIVLVKVVLLMTAMMVVSSGAAHGKGVCEACTFDFVGTSLPTVVCESSVATSPLIGWRDGKCWVFRPVSVEGF